METNTEQNNYEESNTEQINNEEQNTEKLVGQCKWFDKVKGFGFIRGIDTNIDYFVHHTQIVNNLDSNESKELFRYLVAGEYVEFTVQDIQNSQQTDNKVMASNITGIRGGTLMYHTLHQQHVERNTFQNDKFHSDESDGYTTVVRKKKGKRRGNK